MNRGPRCYGPNPMSPTIDLTHGTEFVPGVKLGTWHFGVHYWCLRPPIWYFHDFNSVEKRNQTHGPSGLNQVEARTRGLGKYKLGNLGTIPSGPRARSPVGTDSRTTNMFAPTLDLD